MSWQRSHKPPIGIPMRRDISQIKYNTNNHSNGQLPNTNRGLHTRTHTHTYINIQGIQSALNEDISNFFTHTQATISSSRKPSSLDVRNTHSKDNAVYAPPPTSVPTIRNDIIDSKHLPSCPEGVVRFIHINTGAVCSKQHFSEFKLLLTNISMSQADIYSVNEHNLNTTQENQKKSYMTWERMKSNTDTNFAPHQQKHTHVPSNQTEPCSVWRHTWYHEVKITSLIKGAMDLCTTHW